MKVYSVLERFEFLESLIELVIKSDSSSIIISGKGGLGKSHTAIKVVSRNLYEHEYTMLSGYSTARGLYETLYDNNGGLTILDDYDSIFDDKIAINVLKAALDTKEKRVITWSKSTSGEYPKSFEFTGKIIFITNKNISDLDESLVTRNYIVDLEMTADEKIERIENILDSLLSKYTKDVREKTFKFISEKRYECNLNLRKVLQIANIIANTKNWEDLATYQISHDQ